MDTFNVVFFSIMAFFIFLGLLGCCFGQPPAQRHTTHAANNAPPPQRHTTRAANNAPPPQRDAANDAPDSVHVVIQRVQVVVQSDAANNAPQLDVANNAPSAPQRDAANNDPSAPPVSVFPFYSAAVTAARSGCAICQGDFKDGEEAEQLPGCGHVYHRACIDPWLNIHPTCPICRNSAPPLPNQ